MILTIYLIIGFIIAVLSLNQESNKDQVRSSPYPVFTAFLVIVLATFLWVLFVAWGVFSFCVKKWLGKE